MGKSRGGERRQSKTTVPISEDALHDHHRIVVRGRPANTLNGNGNVGGGHVVIADTYFRPDKRCFRMRKSPEGDRIGGYREFGEVFVGEVNKLIVGDTACAN